MTKFKEIIEDAVRSFDEGDIPENVIIDAFNKRVAKYGISYDKFEYKPEGPYLLLSLILYIPDRIVKDKQLLDFLIYDIEELVNLSVKWKDKNHLKVNVTTFEDIIDSFEFDYEGIIKDIEWEMYDRYGIEYKLDEEIDEEEYDELYDLASDILNEKGYSFYERRIRVRNEEIFETIKKLYLILQKYGVKL